MSEKNSPKNSAEDNTLEKLEQFDKELLIKLLDSLIEEQKMSQIKEFKE